MSRFDKGPAVRSALVGNHTGQIRIVAQFTFSFLQARSNRPLTARNFDAEELS
jgi:hypothetical protein